MVDLPSLISIEIVSCPFLDIQEFVINELPNLEILHIEHHCFRRNEMKIDEGGGLCRITNCPNLRQMEIGDDSFIGFTFFELANVNFLQTVNMGCRCFKHAEDFLLKGK